VIDAISAGSALSTGLREAAGKIRTAVRGLPAREDLADSWVQRIILREIEQRARTRDAAYWDTLFPGLSPAERAQRRIDRMLVRATAAGLVAATSATTAELLSVTSNPTASLAAIPLGVVSIGSELLYTTALQIDLAFDLASIYGVPFADDDIGEISTMLAHALGVELRGEPSQHDKPVGDGQTKPWRVVRQMQRADFARDVGMRLLQQSVLRNVLPIAGIVVSAIWNQIVLRRFAKNVHAAARQRVAIVRACRRVQLGDASIARVALDGAWLIATADGDLEHQEALAISTMIDTLPLPERISVHEASFTDDEEGWFQRVRSLDVDAQDVLLEVLSLIAGADAALTAPERRFLRRLGNTLQRDVDLGAIERMIERLREGGGDRHLRTDPTRSPTAALAGDGASF
jgi:uncharacterized tellurite resistance protein B-like protein